MAFCPGVAGRFFSALAVAEINVVAISQGSSERNISAVVASKDAAAALAAAHSAFFLDLDGEGEGEGEGEKKEAGGAGAGSKVDKAQASREPLSPRRREMQDEIDRLTKEVGEGGPCRDQTEKRWHDSLTHSRASLAHRSGSSSSPGQPRRPRGRRRLPRRTKRSRRSCAS